MRIFLTGANGFLGSRLLRHWAACGHTVGGTHYPFDPPCPGLVPFSLGGPFEPAWLRGADLVVHCAHSFGAETFDQNVAGTRAVYAAARAAGVRHQIFFSSYSARPDAEAEYARVKQTLETFFLDQGQTALRPGLVIGPGGMFGRNMQAVLRRRVVPLVEGGADLLPVIALDDLVAAVTVIAEGGLRGAFNLFNAELVPLRVLLGTLARLARRRILFVSVPCGLADGALRFAETLRLPLPVNSGNLRALRQNQRPVHTSSELAGLIGAECPLERMLAEVLAGL